MQTLSAFYQTLIGYIRDGLDLAIEYAPVLLSALLILLIGWVFAGLIRRVTPRLLISINQLVDRIFQRDQSAETQLPSFAPVVVGTLAYWTVLLLALTLATSVLGFNSLAGWLSQLTAYLPNFILGTIIILVGYFVGQVTHEQLTKTAKASNLNHAALLGRLTQLGIVLTALIIGLDQIGIDVTFLIALFAVSVGAIFIGFSMAFGLGARDHVSNLISARALKRILKPGQMVRIETTEGEITDITATQIELDTSRGRVLIPASTAENATILVISPDDAEAAEND